MAGTTTLWGIAVVALARQGMACTTLAAGKAATADGSVLLSHSDDGESNPDARLCFIPRAEYPAGSQRPIYYDTEDYPRHVGHGRGPCYEPQPGQKPYQPIGYIPQVGQTYAYYEATYGSMNEHGLGIGETTCSGVFGTNSVGHGGKALLSIDSLSRIAMERTKTAREAVKLMGSLAETYGFYGAGSFEGSAESLMVGDADEVFIFHILPDSNNGSSAIWAAQRVPDDHVAVVANMFVIREIDFADAHNFLFSESVKTVALARGWWKPGQPLDFTKVYSDGEYASKFYSGRRVWGAYRKFGINLPDNYTDLRYDAVYPVTAKAPVPTVQPKDFFAIHRDYYQGSKYDMTQGPAAGPWGDPDRWTTTSKRVKGNWERSIGIFRTSSAHVVQARKVARGTGQGTVLWFGPHASAASCFVPLSATATAVPAPYMMGNPSKLDMQSAYWVHRYVFNIAKVKYSHAMADVRALQDKFETEGQELVKRLDTAGRSVEELNAAYSEHAARVQQAFRGLPDAIIEKYADGWLADGAPMGYPDSWLETVGYRNGPPPPPSQPEAATCDDAGVAACVAACSPRGFALCAARCTRLCGEPQGKAELVI
mmetsp:Transcript_32418/g.75317  ORF Transcript_32418/g.75317 Transcript_32418/m.75317 type:complete len:597 (-) Transcript_32418:156-1946(-)